MTLNDILSTIHSSIQGLQGGLRNAGLNSQQGNFPSPLNPRVNPLDVQRTNLLNQRAQEAQRGRGLKQEYDDIINSAVQRGGFVPMNSNTTLGSQPIVPTPQPSPVSHQPTVGRILDVGSYQGVSPSPIPLPERSIQDLLWEQFPNEATQSAVALAGENASFDPNAKNRNNNGTFDYGLFQNNTGTLRDMLGKQRYAKKLAEAGIFKPEDVLGDPRKSAIASKITREYEQAAGAEPWSWWYGWQNKGYNIDPNQSVQDTAKNKAYFKLRERIKKQ